MKHRLGGPITGGYFLACQRTKAGTFRNVRFSITVLLHDSIARFALAMSSRLHLLLLGFLLALSPTGKAQMSAGIGIAYHDLEEISRWGVTGAIYIPVSNHAFDIVPSFEYYYSEWSRGGDGVANDTSDVYVLSADAHANLPALADRARAYIGTGLTYAGTGNEGALGLNLTTGIYVRAQGWRIFPFGQITYRILPELSNAAALDTYFIRSGVRVVL